MIGGTAKGLALPCACMLALVATVAVACSADLCRSLPRMDHCFGHEISRLLALMWITALIAYFANLLLSPSYPS